jgi:hypothetical protein
MIPPASLEWQLETRNLRIQLPQLMSVVEVKIKIKSGASEGIPRNLLADLFLGLSSHRNHLNSAFGAVLDCYPSQIVSCLVNFLLN